jgi:hypothetical protein
MMRRRFIGRRLVRTAAVGGVAYAAGHHMATKSAQQQQMDAQQDAQIEDLQQQQEQQAYQQPAYQQPVYQQAPPPQAPAPPQTVAPAPSFSPDTLATLKQLGELHESGVLTDAEFESAKQKLLGS